MELITDFILITGIVVTAIILFAILRFTEKALPQRLLFVIFLFSFFVSFHAYGEFHDIKWIYSLGFIFADPLGYFLGPLLFLYIKSLFQAEKGLIQKHLFHFIPFLSYFLLITLPFTASLWQGKSLFPYLDTLEQHEYILQLQAIFLLVYCILSLRLLSKLSRAIKGSYSNLQQKDLRWIRYLLVGFSGIISFHLLLTLYQSLGGPLAWGAYYATNFVMIGVILYLGYYGISQSRILLPAYLIEENLVPGPEKTGSDHPLKNANTATIEKLKTRVQQVLAEEQLYLDENLTLSSLAEKIPTTDKKLSALLNQHLHTSFYDLINHFRIEAVKTKLMAEEYQHYTLLAIAFDCGFKSKTSFNRLFKQATGSSPSQYRKKMVK